MKYVRSEVQNPAFYAAELSEKHSGSIFCVAVGRFRSILFCLIHLLLS